MEVVPAASQAGWVKPDHQPALPPHPPHHCRPEFGHQSDSVPEDCGSQPPGCFNQRKVMKRLEGMIYGERLASEESRGRRENSLKVVEITKSAEGGGQCGGRCGAGVLSGSCWGGHGGGSPSGWDASLAQPCPQPCPWVSWGWLELALSTTVSAGSSHWARERRTGGVESSG